MRDKVFSKKEFIASVTENVKTMYRKTLKEATQQEIYQAVSLAVKDVVMDEWMATQQVIEKDDPKILYYMSMEFLMGRALGNNLINLGAYGEVKEALEEIGLDLSVIEDQEPDPALGNGGLGRLAACFMDSLATLGYAAYGCGIRYRYGMFKQQIIDGFQVEVPDNWLKDGYPFELRRPEYCYEIKFGGHVEETAGEDGNLHFEQVGYQSVLAIPYDMPIVGYGNHVVDSLMIWDAQPNLISQLKEQGKEDKYEEVLAEVPRVRKDLGEPPLVTPSSQIVGTQAVFNVLMGERYKVATKETKDILLGKYGQTVKPFNPEVVDKVLGEDKKNAITCRPADLLEPELGKIEAEMKQYKQQDEDVLSYALFPQVATDFFKYREAQQTGVDAKTADTKNGAYPV